MWPFNTCNHHWGSARLQCQFKIERLYHGRKVKLKEKKKSRCQHEGCNAENIKWETVGTCSFEELRTAVKDAF